VSTQVVEGDTVMMEVASMDMLSEEGTVYFHFTMTMGEAAGPSDCTHEYTYLEPDPENEANMIEYCDECGAVLGVHAPGTEKNPILVDFLYDEVTMNLYGTVTVPAGESLWFGQYRIGGMILVVNGVEYGMLEDAGFYDPVVFKLTNDTDADVTYEILLTWPLGSDYNPGELPVNDSTELYLPENSYEFAYQWFATADGELTITIEGENWLFHVNNYTSYVYGDYYYDCYGDANTVTIQVAAGDEIMLYVGTMDADWNTPEATLTITTVFACAHKNLVHVEAVVPGCYEEGNIEHWYCEDCETVWADEALTQITNHKSVILPATHQNVVHVEAKAPSCYEEGNLEYWYCEDCETVWVDEAMMQISNMMSIVLPATHQHVVHVEAVAPTCTEHGNVEYWYCEDCLTVWVDEDLLQISNMKNIVDPAIGHNYVDGVCANCGENDKNVPDTGDMIALACVLSAVSGMTIIALPKKKEN
jgi:NAD-dependent SIR2 family protein deacetylase